MRVSTKALASVTALLFFSACVTPPPIPRDGGSYRNASYEPPAQDRYNDGDYGPDDPRSFEQGRYADSGHYSRRPTARVGIHLGGRQLETLDFEPTDELGVFGVDFVQVRPPGNLGLEFGLMFAYDEENNVTLPNSSVGDLELSQAEIYVGARSEFGDGPIRPYIGGGGTLLSATRTLSQGFTEADDDDTTVGVYLHGGIQADINEVFSIGIDYRHVFGRDFEFDGAGGTSFDVDSDYDQLTFVLGFNL